MKKVEDGLYVSVDYTATLKNGRVLDSTMGYLPMEIKMGAENLVGPLKEALVGMSLNEKKVVELSMVAAYGERDEEAVYTYLRNEIPEGVEPKVDEIFTLKDSEGNEIPARFTHVDDKKVIVDLNHPLAGEMLMVDLEVVNISETPTQGPSDPAAGKNTILLSPNQGPGWH